MAVNDLNISFDEKGFYNDLIKQLVEAMTHLSLELLNLFSAGATTHTPKKNMPRISNIDGFWRYSVEKTADAIVSVVGNDNWYAFISNYGSGSLMARDNPWLKEYMESEFFNPERLSAGMAVLSREGEYNSPNYSDGMGTTTMQGKGLKDKNGNPANLENMSGKFSNGHSYKYFTPQPPSYWLEHGMAVIEKRMFDVIQEVIDNFPAHNYLKGGI